MRSHHIRTFGLLVGLIAVLGMTSIAAGESLTDQQIGRQIERRLSEDAFGNVNVSVQASVVSLSGTVSSLWAKEEAIAEARELEDVESVVSDALEIERAESDLAIAEQIGKQIRRVSIPGPLSAARPGVSSPPGVAESTRPRSSFNHHGPGFGFDDHRFGFDQHGSDFGLGHHEDDTGDTEFHRDTTVITAGLVSAPAIAGSVLTPSFEPTLRKRFTASPATRSTVSSTTLAAQSTTAW